MSDDKARMPEHAKMTDEQWAALTVEQHRKILAEDILAVIRGSAAGLSDEGILGYLIEKLGFAAERATRSRDAEIASLKIMVGIYEAQVADLEECELTQDAEIAKLRECAESMANEIERHTEWDEWPCHRNDAGLAVAGNKYRASFPKPEAKP